MIEMILTKITKKDFTKCSQFWHHSAVSAKSLTEPRNSNYLRMANSSTPFYRAFFVRSLRTPQERPEPLEGLERHSMVACSGKGFALCCVPYVAVFEPVARYRPQASKLQAVTSSKFFRMGLIAMIYQFLGISRQHYDRTKAEQIRIQADNEQQARAYLARHYVLILLGRLPNSAKNDRTLVIQGGIYA
ncbi:host cell division inhibitor Icd-like protein [Pasteurella sp. PK-2025]|uniref:host cell division inhibitor Icd-like protein n=1 Tax=Pasteurella sp. PK-2025 TaxID=3413133 RepID=UPI003C7910C4